MAVANSVAKCLLLKLAQDLGFSSVRPKQEEAITSFMNGNDVFVSLPTGYGKSLCYAMLPLLFDELKEVKTSIILVIAPLTSIMDDQVATWTGRGIKAVHVGGPCDDCKDVKGRIKRGDYQIVFISPESLFCHLEWRQMLCSDVYRSNLIGVVVDEAHCIKKWGDTFRKEFSQLGELRSLVPEHVHVMAMTATATQETRKAIFKSLHMVRPVIIYTRPVKNNITYSVAVKSSTREIFDPIIKRLLKERTSMGRIIIFCKKCSEVAVLYHYFKKCMRENFTDPKGAPDFSRYRLVEMYSKCTKQYLKKTIVEQFTKSSCLRIVICTIAFGMGIDCPDVREIIHWGVPEDCEMYVQESGRAGRDGLQCHAIIYHGSGDLNKKYVAKQMIKYCRNPEKQCRREILFDDCNKNFITPVCLCCDICQLAVTVQPSPPPS